MTPAAFNLADLFELVADAVPERVAVVCRDRHTTYRELEERANRLAHGLADLGVAAGDHVGLYLHNGTEFLESMLACFKLRAVPINVNYRYVGDELAYVADDADLVALVHHRALTASVAAVADRLPRLRALIEVDDDSPKGEPMGQAYEDVLGVGGPGRDFVPRSPDDHYVLYTGGTTGMPKGVIWRQEDIFFACLGGGNAGGPPIERPEDIGRTVLVNRAQRAAPFLEPGDAGPDEWVALALGPLMHAGGQWLALGTLLGGGRVVLYAEQHMDLRRVLELVERERITMISLVGDATAAPLVELLEAEPGAYDTSSLLLLGSGGAILSAAVKDRLLAALPTVLAIVDGVGSSESPAQAVSVVRRHDGPASPLRFAAKAETMVVDQDLRPLPAGSGRVGRLATKGRVPLGYHKDPERTARTFVEIDGERWALPGDMATVEADGSIRLVGRGALCINTGGEKVYPEEVEAVVKAHPSVADAVIVGAPDPRFGQKVVAVVQPRLVDSGGPTLEELQTHCRAHLAGYKVPRALRLVDAVVRSPAGKADYRWAAEVAAAAGAADPVSR